MYNITISKTREEADRVAAWYLARGVPVEVVWSDFFEWWQINTDVAHFDRALRLHARAAAIINVITGEVKREAAWA